MPDIIANINKVKNLAVAIQKIEGVGGGGGATTNLSYTASPTQGQVNSDTGTDAIIPATDSTNAGLFLPAEKTKLAGIIGTNTGDETTGSILNKIGNGSTIDDNYIPNSIARDSEILTKTLDTFTPTNSAIVLGNTVLQSLEKAQGQINNLVPYTGATANVDLGNFGLNAKSVHVKGTAGQGHLALKHQSANANASTSESALYADSSGDLKWKNDNLYNTTLKTSTNTADRVYTFPDRSGTLLDNAGVIETNSGSGSAVQSGYAGIDGEFGIVRVVNNKGNVPTQYVNLGTGNQEFWINGNKKLEINSSNISLENNQIKNLGTPTVSTDATTKSYVDTGLATKENTITAGTTSQYYRGDKTFQTLDKTAVGLSNVDNTSDLNKPISTSTQTALNAKQDTLVSGTNIKTINSQSVLGSGNLSIAGGITMQQSAIIAHFL